MYKLTLSLDERKALDFVGYRYACGDELINLLIESMPEWDSTEWTDRKDVTFNVPENLAWSICECVYADTEDLRTSHPLLSDEFFAKLVKFTLAVV